MWDALVVPCSLERWDEQIIVSFYTKCKWYQTHGH